MVQETTTSISQNEESLKNSSLFNFMNSSISAPKPEVTSSEPPKMVWGQTPISSGDAFQNIPAQEPAPSSGGADLFSMLN